MMDIGKSSRVGRNKDNQRPKKISRSDKTQEELPVDDDAVTLKCMFDLLTNPKSSKMTEAQLSTWLGTLKIADKYDYSIYEPIFIGRLWEWAAKGDTSALWVFGIAVELKHEALALYAACLYGDYTSEKRITSPAEWSLTTVENLGFRAWYYLVQAGEKCKPFEWKEIANHLELPAG